MSTYRLTFAQTFWASWVHGWNGGSCTSDCAKRFRAGNDRLAKRRARELYAKAKEGTGYVSGPKLFKCVRGKKPTRLSLSRDVN